MTLPEFSLKRRVTTFMIYAAMIIFGLMSYFGLALDLMPSFEIPVALVQTSYSGAGSEEIENLVTRPIEQAAARVAGIDVITSTSSEGSSMVVIQFTDDTNMDTAIVDLRESVEMVSSFLPDGATSPMILAIDPQAMPIIQASVRSETADLSKIQSTVENVLIPSLERIKGVASVEITGGFENEIVIDTYSDALSGYGVSVDYIANILRADNISLPSGEVMNGDKTLTVRTDGEFTSIDDVKNAIIPLPTGGTVRLSEIADVTEQRKDITSIAKLNGTDALSISVQKQSGINTVEVTNKVYVAFEAFEQDTGYEIVSLFDQAEYINLSVDSVMQNVLYGVLFAVVVLLFFLKNIRTTFVIALSMPICLIGTFAIMGGLELTMNTMTLGGMAMGVGMIVDNSVVVLENIYKYREEGYSRFESCIEGSKEVALSITASTLTTIAVFLPIGLSGGITGQLFFEFCVTITALLVCSLVIALTLVPLLCYTVLDDSDGSNALKSRQGKHPIGDTLSAGYKNVLKACLKFRKTSLVAAFLLFVVFLGSLAFVGFELMPATDQGTITISVNTPVGSELFENEEIADDIVMRVEDIDEIESIFYTSSGSSTSITLNLVELADRDRSVFAVADEVRELTTGIAGAEISISDAGSMDMSAMSATGIQIKISGDEFDVLEDIANDLVEQISSINGTVDVKSSMSDRIPQVEIKLNKLAASNFGLTSGAVGTAVNAQLQGASATTLKIAGDEIDVVVKGDSSYADNIDALNTIPISTQAGITVPLGMIADVSIEQGSISIQRENQTRQVTVSSDYSGVDITSLTAEVQNVISNYPLPQGYMIDFGGESEEIAESFGTLTNALIASIALVYLVLASQFESMLLPFIVMLAMPLGLAGGLFGLFVTSTTLSMSSFIGVIMLSGIVVNNSIVLIDYIKIREERGEDMMTAIVNACPRRVRPVMMTTLTTILGLLPMALATGENSETMKPMAIVMISGLIISTAVTLIFSPVFYAILKTRSVKRLQKIEAKKAKRLAKRLAKLGTAPAPSQDDDNNQTTANIQGGDSNDESST